MWKPTPARKSVIVLLVSAPFVMLASRYRRPRCDQRDGVARRRHVAGVRERVAGDVRVADRAGERCGCRRPRPRVWLITLFAIVTAPVDVGVSELSSKVMLFSSGTRRPPPVIVPFMKVNPLACVPLIPAVPRISEAGRFVNDRYVVLVSEMPKPVVPSMVPPELSPPELDELPLPVTIRRPGTGVAQNDPARRAVAGDAAEGAVALRRCRCR